MDKEFSCGWRRADAQMERSATCLRFAEREHGDRFPQFFAESLLSQDRQGFQAKNSERRKDPDADRQDDRH